MRESYNLLPELKLELGDVFKPELEQILFYFKDEKVWTKLVYSESSGIESEEGDLSFIVDDSGPVFTVANSLEQNKKLFLNLDNMTVLMAIGDAFTEDGVNQLIKE
jgi:hypothetical protein